MPDLHPATRGFADADVYERGRPDYPAAAIAAMVAELDLRAGRTVLDLAAGTGKLTRLLVPSGANVTRSSRSARCARRSAAGAALAGTAERMPLTERYVDAVTVGQAFHWFDADAALREIHRVLRPGGGRRAGLERARRAQSVQAALTKIIDPLDGDTPRRKQRNWKTVLADSGLFDRRERKLFEHVQPVDEQGRRPRASISFVAASPPDVRAEVEARVRASRATRSAAAVHDRAVPRVQARSS